MPSAGLCTTVVWASWGEVGDTLPCREGDGWGREEEEGTVGGGGHRDKDAEEHRPARRSGATTGFSIGVENSGLAGGGGGGGASPPD